MSNQKNEEQAGVQVSDDVKQTCLSLITNTPVCQLTTIDSAGFPHTSAMNNLRYAKQYPSLVDLFKGQDNDFVLYMATGKQSPKMARIKANPKVSVYFCNADQIVGLMLGGEIEIIADQQLKNRIWQKDWTMYFPGGPEGPEFAVIKLVPNIVKGWCKGRPLEVKI
jgi:general stress protein 26